MIRFGLLSTAIDLIVWAIGARPATELAVNAGVAADLHGPCKVTRRMETNLSDIYAAGDCADTWHRVLDPTPGCCLARRRTNRAVLLARTPYRWDVEFAGGRGRKL